MDLGIDLGTANTVMSDVRRGIVFDEPSVMLLRQGSSRRRQVQTVGRDASDLLGRAPARFTAVRPLHDGVVTDLETARLYLRAVLERAGRRAWSPVRAVIGVPADSTALETRALLEAAQEAGIRPVTALDDSVAGAVGCGVDPLERRVHMVVDVGGGTAEAVAFCFGGVLAHRTSKVGGDEMTVAVARYLREQHQLHLGSLEAERVKVYSATAEQDGPLVVHGRDGASGRPRLATVQAAEVAEAVRPVVNEVVRALTGCLDDLPPQALADVLAEGVLVFGGASLVTGFTQHLERELGLPVKLAEEPLTCVAEGAARALRNRALLAAYGRG
jgi:rod shape-determining protein MreB and related proteins